MFLTIGNAMWSLLAHSDAMTKAILVLLLGVSIVSWTIIFYKAVLVYIKKRQLRLLEETLKKAISVADCKKIIADDSSNYGVYLVSEELAQGALIRRNCDRDFLMFDENMYGVLEEYATMEYSYLPFLAMVSSTAPFVGLLGTVWGLTHAFISISECQMADIVTIAPGIAEAFITTLAGLIVAIPALVAYHYCKAQAESSLFALERIAQRVKVILYRSHGDV